MLNTTMNLRSQFQLNFAKTNSYNNTASRLHFTSCADSFALTSNCEFKKAKAECIKTSKADVPYKKFFILDEKNNTIVGSIRGANLISLFNNPLFKKASSDSAIMYCCEKIKQNGKPICLFGLDDFKFLNATNVKTLIIVSESGDIIKISKNEKFQKLDIKQQETLTEEFFVTLYASLPDKTKQQIACMGNIKNIDYLMGAIKIQELSQSGMKILDNFWKNIAPSLNLTYTSNLTY